MNGKNYGISMDLPPQIIERLDVKDKNKTTDPDAWKKEPIKTLSCECGRPVILETGEGVQPLDGSDPLDVARSLEWMEYLYRCECGVFIYIRVRSYSEILAFMSAEPGKKEG